MDLSKMGFKNFKDKEFRASQTRALDFALSSIRPLIALSAPTGSGKSLVGMVAGKQKSEAAYCCHSKALQNQLVQDFPRVAKLWGRSNYRCLRYRRVTAAECSHTKDNRCPNIGQCLYRLAKNKALAAPLASLNYSYFLTEANYVGRFSGRPLVVCDEGDVLEHILMDFITLSFQESELKRLKLAPPARKTAQARDSMDVWKKWAEDTKFVVQSEVERLGDGLEGIDFDNCNVEEKNLFRMWKKFGAILFKLNTFLRFVDNTWLFEDSTYGGKRKFSFSPLWVTEDLAKFFLWRHMEQGLLMSATLPPPLVLSRILGVPAGDIAYQEIPSSFPIANRPIFLNPVVNLTRDTTDEQIPSLLAEIERIMQAHANEKGVIHSVSYRMAKIITEGIDSGRFISHNSQDRISKIEAFKKADWPAVLVSPSSDRGVSYDGDMCRFVIFPKAPWLSLADKKTKTRAYSGKMGNYWYQNAMLMSVLQGAGRGVRSETDFCQTYILDRQIVNAMGRHPEMLPGWFKDAIR